MISEKILLPCGVEVKNRFLKSAMTEGLADANAEANIKHQALYTRRARGVLGISVTGNVQVEFEGMFTRFKDRSKN